MSPVQLLRFIHLGLNYELPKLGAEIPEMPEIAEQPLFVNALERYEDGKVKARNSYQFKGRQDDIPKENYNLLDTFDKN